MSHHKPTVFNKSFYICFIEKIWGKEAIINCVKQYDYSREVLLYQFIQKNTNLSDDVSLIFHCSLSGLSPFMGDTDLETMANVTIAEYDYEDEAFNEISDQAKDFVDKLLIKKKE